jgi:hypothetical protein
VVVTVIEEVVVVKAVVTKVIELGLDTSVVIVDEIDAVLV